MIRSALSLALIVTFAVSLVGQAVGSTLEDDLDEIRDSIRAVADQIDDVVAERSVLAQDILLSTEKLDTAENEVSVVREDLVLVTSQYEERSIDLEEVRAELVERFSELAIIRTDRDSARKEAETSVIEAYMSGGTSQPAIAFSASEVSVISVGVAYLDVLTNYRSDAADHYALLAAAQEIEEEKVKSVESSISKEVEELKEVAEEIRAAERDLDYKLAALEAEYEQQVELLSRIEEEIDEFENEAANLEREEDSIKAKIEDASRPTGTRPDSILRPVPGAISSGFGMRHHPILNRSRMHNGVDMNAGHGDPIIAVSGGTVILVRINPDIGFGNYVMIDHGGGMVTLYAHQSRVIVSVGESVDAGEVIGYIGSTGLSTGPHLHFEVRINGVPSDPVNYF